MSNQEKPLTPENILHAMLYDNGITFHVEVRQLIYKCMRDFASQQVSIAVKEKEEEIDVLNNRIRQILSAGSEKLLEVLEEKNNEIVELKFIIQQLSQNKARKEFQSELFKRLKAEELKTDKPDNH